MSNESQTLLVLPKADGFEYFDLKTEKPAEYINSHMSIGKNTICILYGNKIRYLSRIEGKSLTLFITSTCNQLCVMCPQYLNDDSPENDKILRLIIKYFDFSQIETLYLTGGEPLLKVKILDLLKTIENDNLDFVLLTNGTIPLSESVLAIEKLTICIPLYGSYFQLHDWHTGTPSFYSVINNLLKLSVYHKAIELRFVITRKNYKNIPLFAEFVYNTLPFIANVAFMGIELMELAKKNANQLWIDPKYYIGDLCQGIDYLSDFTIPVSVYNLQHCLFSKKYHPYLHKAISPHKVVYLKNCPSCSLYYDCGGFFKSNVDNISSLGGDYAI